MIKKISILLAFSFILSGCQWFQKPLQITINEAIASNDPEICNNAKAEFIEECKKQAIPQINSNLLTKALDTSDRLVCQKITGEKAVKNCQEQTDFSEALNKRDETLCSQLNDDAKKHCTEQVITAKNDDELGKMNKIITKALLEGNSGLCDDLPKDQISLCKKTISDQLDTDQLMIATSANNEAACQKINSEIIRSNCVNMISGKNAEIAAPK